MKQQCIFLAIGILIVVLIIIWTISSKQIMEKLKIINTNSITLNKNNRILEIKREDIEQHSDPEDLFYSLTQKYLPEFNGDQIEKLDLVSQTFVLIVIANGQIQNGGIIQFIDNGSGDNFHETIEAARRIKNDTLVDVFTKVMTQYPKGKIPKDWDTRRKLWDKLSDKHENDEDWINFWEDLDKKYYKNSNSIYQSLIDYLKSNAKLID